MFWVLFGRWYVSIVDHRVKGPYFSERYGYERSFHHLGPLCLTVGRIKLDKKRGSLMNRYCCICGTPIPEHLGVGRKRKTCPPPKDCRGIYKRQYKKRQYKKQHPRILARKYIPHPLSTHRQDIRALSTTGASQSAIGRRLGISRERVRQLLHKEGLYEAWAAVRLQRVPFLKGGGELNGKGTGNNPDLTNYPIDKRIAV